MSDLALRVGQSLLRITGALAAVFGLLLAAILVFTTMPGSSHRGALPAASAHPIPHHGARHRGDLFSVALAGRTKD